MALQRSLTQTFRKNMLAVGSGWRAYFAPYNPAIGSAVADTALGPKILDLSQGPFNDSALPAGWYDLGWIKDANIAPESKIGKVRSGYRGAVRAEYRGQVGEKISFKFREMSRMATKVATGGDVFNLLDGGVASTSGPLAGSGTTAVSMVSYDANGPTLVVAAAASGSFPVGSLIVCDLDYNGTDYGIVGDAGTHIFQGQVVDANYLRKTSDYVARVVANVGGTLTLSKRFVGGGSGLTAATAYTEPQAGSKVQPIIGFAAREGGTFIKEWSAMFLMDTQDLGQFLVYYPHIAPSQFRGMGGWQLEDIGTTDTQGYELDCEMESLAFDDSIDGQTCVRYLAYYPPIGADVSI